MSLEIKRISKEIDSIAVVYFADGWRIVAGDRRWGRFQFRVDAEEAALRLAGQSRLAGKELKIIVQDSSGQFHAVASP
jgi:hypothetical protein